MVACVKGFTPVPPDSAPVKGMVYTVREVCVVPDSGTGLRLEEVVNWPQQFRDGFVERSFSVDGFRPVVETDISVFTAMLAPKEKERARA